jgi:actin-related protein 8
MVGKKSGKALLREEGKRDFFKTIKSKLTRFAGLARTDNGMKQTSWPEVPMINQKNYYTYVFTFHCSFRHCITGCTA